MKEGRRGGGDGGGESGRLWGSCFSDSPRGQDFSGRVYDDVR